MEPKQVVFYRQNEKFQIVEIDRGTDLNEVLSKLENGEVVGLNVHIDDAVTWARWVTESLLEPGSQWAVLSISKGAVEREPKIPQLSSEDRDFLEKLSKTLTRTRASNALESKPW